VYVKCGFEPTAVPDPLAMLASIEVWVVALPS
jgi:hypothetical protein